MIAEPLAHVLEAAGYLADGAPAAPSVRLLEHEAHEQVPSFKPDAWWRSNPDADYHGTGSLTVYFKYAQEPNKARIAEWQREIWNRGFSPLLWLVCPDGVELYNGFGVPQGPEHATANRLDTFSRVDAELARLDTIAGRLAMETGRFWEHEPRVNRATSVADCLLSDLHRLEEALIEPDFDRDQAQSLIGRCIFTKYLIDREIVAKQLLRSLCGHRDLADILDHRPATDRLFEWLREKFNGDMFPQTAERTPAAKHLAHVARFLRKEDPDTGQLHLFPYRFDVIPVELISAIYEQFVHSSASTTTGENHAKDEGVYYTPLAAVSLVLDEVFNGLTGDETVLDLTCGSGVFLVEAFRRLVHLKAGSSSPSRELIRSTLYTQVYGVDKSEPAVRIAAFSLYLAALELDPDPQPPEKLRFKPLRGRTLLVGDARVIQETPDGQRVLIDESGLKQFDLIVGNPPWSYTGKAGTAVRRAAGSEAPLQPRGQSLDFVARARNFAHDKTRFGMILSATPFFGRSRTGIRAAQEAIQALAPVTLINLSDLYGWLFPKADMPGIALIAGRHGRRADRMTLVQTHWSPASERSHTIEIAPTDVVTLPIESWKRNAGLFKAGFLGRQPDLLLLDELCAKHEPLAPCLQRIGVRLRAGLIFGNRSRDASFLKGLPFLAGRKALKLFSLNADELPAFEHERAQWPRNRGVYRAPLLLVKEFMQGKPRAGVVVAVSEQDVAFTAACYGASFANARPEAAYLVAGILGSALASWYFLMSGSAFGLWMRRLMHNDFCSLPMPDLQEYAESEAGRRVVRLAQKLHGQVPGNTALEALDEAVFDLYKLDDASRIVVRDGLVRAGCQWKAGRERSVAPAAEEDLREYARAFLSAMDAWLSVGGSRRMRAEIYAARSDAPHRVIRFVLEEQPGPSVMEVVEPDGSLNAVFTRIGKRAAVQIGDALVGVRELRVHASDEVSIIKPAARRHWLRVRGLEDADAVVKDSACGGPTT